MSTDMQQVQNPVCLTGSMLLLVGSNASHAQHQSLLLSDTCTLSGSAWYAILKVAQ